MATKTHTLETLLGSSYPLFLFHLDQLENIIANESEPLEGNYIYQDNTLLRHSLLESKQINLGLISQSNSFRHILEIGFNAGHSALLLLMFNPLSELLCFDIGSHSYSKKCFSYLETAFPNRIRLIWGDSKTTLPKYICNNPKQQYDFVHIDGCKTGNHVVDDIQFCKLISIPNALLLVNDTWMNHVHTQMEYVQNIGHITSETEYQSILKPVEMYANTLCQYCAPKIAICSLAIGEKFKQITLYSTLSKVLYCKQHGYAFVHDESVCDKTRPIAWSKIRLILSVLPFYDTVVWMDSDLYIMNPNIAIEYICNTHLPETSSMLLARDTSNLLNTGVWFIRNTVFSFQFLIDIYEQEEFIHHGNWEQTAFIALYDQNHLDAQSNIREVFQTYINSYWFNYEWSHFILHFAGCRKLSTLEHVMTKYCPVKRFDETEDEYSRRIHWIEHESREYEQNKLKPKSD